MVTKPDWNKIREIIANDASLRYRYYQDGETCVIGGLAAAAGYQSLLEKLQLHDFWNLQRIQKAHQLASRVGKHYGLSEDQLIILQQINDAEENTETRRASLIQQINGWEANN